MTAPTELLPCPFCGGECSPDSVVRYSESHAKEQGWAQTEFYYCNCIRCGADNKGIIGHKTRDKAIAAWNHRTPLEASPQPANPAQVTELIEDLEQAVIDFENARSDTYNRAKKELQRARAALTAAIGAGGQAVACKECDGTGFKDKNGARLTLARTPCGACGGSGYVAALSQPIPVAERVIKGLPECTTEGCGKPSTVYLEHGCIGSYYCHDCYMRVLTLAKEVRNG